MTKTDYFDEMIYYFTFIRKYIYMRLIMVLVMILVNLSKNEILRFEAKVTKLEEYDGTRVFNTKIIVTDCNFDTEYDNYNKILNSLNDMKKIVKKKLH